MREWCPEVISFLDQQDYQKVISCYEERIENNPNDITNYWYLGLAYLLVEQNEDAQATWFLLFSQSDQKQLEIWTKDLTCILDREAFRQETLKNYSQAKSIRFNLKEIDPENINNLLHLVNLGFILEDFNLDYLKEWRLIDLIKVSLPENIDQELLKEVLNDILKYPCPESMEFTEAVLSHTKGEQTLIDKIVAASQHMIYEKRYYLFSVDLIKECLKQKPEDIYLLQELFWRYRHQLDYENGLAIVKQLDKLVPLSNLPLKTYIKTLYLAMYLATSDWISYREVAEEYKNLLSQITRDISPIKEKFVIESFLITVQHLLYLRDSPRENRPIFNTVAYLFQKHIQEKFCCPVDFPLLIKEKKILKIGYIGHTLRGHSVGWLSRWLIHYHNQENFEVYLYLLNQHEDEITQKWFREKATKCYNLTRDVLNTIRQIQKDEIDILVDLDSVTFNLTNMVMSAKPAPIQATWLGLDATGLPAIDYFIADNYVLPENADNYYQEKIWRLPTTYLAVDGFEVDVPNINRQDLEIDDNAVIFLNVQGALKRNPQNIHLQMKILKAIPHSYLLIKGSGTDKFVQELFKTIAEKEQVSISRLRFLPKTTTEAIHRANLAIADVVLDTYPYNGATTTLETLWMEIPLVTRVGEQFAARNSYTFMMNAGINEGIAWSDQEYIEWGIRLGTDKNLRKEISWKLRQSKKTSPLWNGKQFTREMEKAYQQMWEIYVKTNK